MRLDGVRAVARQEFRLRIRAGRWKWLLGAWFVVLLLFTLLARFAVNNVEVDQAESRGTVMYGALMLFVLALALLVTPALSAQSVNGDRERGTLATLQVTRLSAGEIAVGKFVAAWGTALVFLGLSLPLVVWCMAEGGVTFVRVLTVTVVVALLLGTVVATSLCLSAVLARSTTSSVLSYLLVFTLTAGTLIAFGLGTAMTSERKQRTEEYVVPVDPRVDIRQGPDGQWVDPQGNPVETRTETSTWTESVTHTEKTWWLLAPNPFVVLADAAPVREPRTFVCNGDICEDGGNDIDVLGEIGRAVRDLRDGPDEPTPATDAPLAAGDEFPPAEDRGAAVWPWGLAVNIALAIGALWLTRRRLRTPARELPRGQRVA